MAMPNSEYWAQRFAQLENAQHSLGESAKQEISKMYDRAQAEIEAQIDKWYRKLAQNNNISMAEAQKWLKGKQLKEFHWDVGDYIEYGKENAVNKMWMKELENASAKFHISKLESLNISLEQSLQKLFTGVENVTADTLSNCYKEGYYRTMYEFQKGFEVGFDIAKVNNSYVEKVLVKPWAADGYNFSENIWKYKTKLINSVHNEITNNLLTGADPQKAIDAIAKQMSNSKFNASRLVMTEEAYFSALAAKDCYKELDVEKYEILATLDEKTSNICQSMDGKVFEMKYYQSGLTAPPFHCFCRSTTVPAFDNEYDITGSRAARDSDGKTYYVPGDMRYNDWKNAFVNGDKSEYDLKEINGTTYYSHKSAPAPEPKPKKIYLTKKKLQANIADADVKIKELEKKLGTSDDKDIKAQIDAITQQKNEWQTKLDDKIAKEQKKELNKQIIDLKKEQAEIQKKIDEAEVKTYSGIWKDPVTTKDYPSLNIAGKKSYYESKLSSGSLTEEKKKEFEQYLKQLEELEKEGAAYAVTADELKKTQAALKKAESDLKSIEKYGKIKTDDRYSPDRKNNAVWAKSTATADKKLRSVSGEVWKNASKSEKDAIYDYTTSYSKYNEPLRGIDYGTNKYIGVGKVDLDKIGIHYGNYKTGQVRDQINRMTDIIDRSEYDFDIWVQRGCHYNGMDKFFNISENDLRYASTETLEQKLLDKDVTDYGFFSCGVSKGTGFSGSPIIMNVYCPKGTKMMYAEPFSAYGNGAGRKWDGISEQNSFGSESEIILQQGTKFRITKVERTGGKLYIDIEVVSQDTLQR